MKVLFDHNLSPALARAFRELFKGKHEIVALSEKFSKSATDMEWIGTLGREGSWIVISGDRRITRNRHEAEAFRRAKLVGFFLSEGLQKSKVVRQAERLLALWDAIELKATSSTRDQLYILPVKSRQIRPMRPL